MDVRDSEDDTLVMGKFTDETIVFPMGGELDSTLVDDALELVADLWPRPKSATVTLETHQWVKLRRVLLAFPDIWSKAVRNG